MQVICSPQKKINTKGALFARVLVFGKQLVVSISLNNYMPLENRKWKKYFHFGNVLTNLWASIYQLRTKSEKIKTLKTSCWTKNKYFQYEVWKTSQRNMEYKILGFQFKPVSTKPTHSSYKFQKLRHFVSKVKQNSLGIRMVWNLQKRSLAGVFQNKCS